MTFDKSKYDQEYIKKNIVRKQIQFNRLQPEDMQMLAWAESKGNFNAYIRSLIQQDMGKLEDSTRDPDPDPESRG